MRVRFRSATVNPLSQALSSLVADLARFPALAGSLVIVVLLAGTACTSQVPARALGPEDGSSTNALSAEPGTDAPYSFQTFTVTNGMSQSPRRIQDAENGPLPNVLFAEPGTDATHNFQAYSVTIGMFSSDTTQKNTGPRSIKLNTGKAPGTDAYVQKDSLVGNSARISTYVRFASFPDSNSTILKVGNSKGDGVFSIAVTPAGYLQLLNWKVSDVVQLGPMGTFRLDAGVWYRLGLAYDLTDATHYTARVFVNGAEDISVKDSPALTTVDPTLVRWGWVWTGSEYGAGKVLNIDDIYVDDSNSGRDAGDVRGATILP